MKIDRLIGIIATLQRQGQVTAPYLAEKFEVSRRTINRDIETICRAGIPIVTAQGAGGGVSLMKGCTLDAGVLTRQELAEIFAGLATLDSVAERSGAAALARKLGLDSPVTLPGNMLIDLASFYHDDLTAKLALIKRAIGNRRRIAFHYCAPGGESERTVEPYLLIFRWSDWYLFGFCLQRQDYRLFKLRRLWNMRETDGEYAPRELPAEKLCFGKNMTDDYMVTAIYAPEVKYRLAEEYGPDSFRELPDGRLYTEWGFSGMRRALDWLISFGDRVEVVAPPEMKALMRETAEKIAAKYSEHDIKPSYSACYTQKKRRRYK